MRIVLEVTRHGVSLRREADLRPVRLTPAHMQGPRPREARLAMALEALVHGRFDGAEARGLAAVALEEEPSPLLRGRERVVIDPTGHPR